MKVLKKVAVLLAVLAAAVPALAQDARGRIQGAIIDSSGAVVPGVSVTLTNDATGVAVTRQSGREGRYVFDQIDPGTYTITAELAGFASIVQKNVPLRQRGDATVNLSLKPSSIQETVVVEAAPVGVQFNTALRDLTVNQEVIKQLPLATRNPATLARLDPSVTGDLSRSANFDHYAANAYDIGGATMGQNDILIDGSPLANSSKLAYSPPVDAVAEYTVVQNAIDAEYGHTAGGIVTMSLKSGSNKMHGSAYYFGGDPDWNAMTNRGTQQHSKNASWNGGATFGFPIIKNKLFMFSTFERQTDNSYTNPTYTLPTELERKGNFSQSFNADGSLRVIYDPLTSRVENGKVVRDPFPGNIIPANRWDPVAQKMLQNLWLPNNAGDDRTGLNNYKYELLRDYRYKNFSTRVDWQINERWKTFARVGIFVTEQGANDYTNGADVLKMRRTEGSERNGYNFAADSIYTFNPTTMLTVRGAYYKTIDRRNYPEMNVGEEGYNDLWPSGWYQPYMEGRPIVYFPNFQIPSGDTFGVRNFWWQSPVGYSMGAKLSKYFGKHAAKIGVDTRFKRGEASRFFFANMAFTYDNTANTTAGANSKTGNPWASFLLGTMNPSSSSVQFTPMQESNAQMYAVYVQDDFTVTDKLTINLGLRYEYETGYSDSQNRLPRDLDLTDPIPGMQANIDPKIPADIKAKMAQSAGQNSYLYNGAFYFTEEGKKYASASDALQFMPRLGLAYRLDDKTALRAGYARFYTPPALTDSGNEPLGSYDMAAFSPTTNVLPLNQGVPQAYLANPFPQGLTPAYGKSYGRYTNLGDNITIDEYERRPPVSDRVHLSLQREIWGRTVVDVTYLTNFTSRVMQTINLNMADPRLSNIYKTDLTKQVANPFYNYGTVETFPGQLRRQATVAVSQLLRPYPQYGDINQTSTDFGKYRLQSLQVRLQRPFSKGYSFLASYAYNLEKAQQFYDNQDQYDRILTWVDSQNPRHRVVATAVVELPLGRGRRFGGEMAKGLDLLLGGWQVAGVYTYRSGAFLRFGAMVAPESVTKIGEVGKDKYWFDTTGFSTLPAYTRRANPNQYDGFTGPNFWNVDATISKSFKLPRDTRLEFRLEAYNAFNHMNWANPQLSITASDFGRTYTQAANYTGRTLQYAFRLEF